MNSIHIRNVAPDTVKALKVRAASECVTLRELCIRLLSPPDKLQAAGEKIAAVARGPIALTTAAAMPPKELHYEPSED